jgi:hypothetical protein
MFVVEKFANVISSRKFGITWKVREPTQLGLETPVHTHLENLSPYIQENFDKRDKKKHR